MTKTIIKNYEKLEIDTTQIIATKLMSNYGGIAIHDIDDEIVILSWYDDDPKAYKLYYNNKGIYFNLNNSRYYLDEFMRTNIN